MDWPHEILSFSGCVPLLGGVAGPSGPRASYSLWGTGENVWKDIRFQTLNARGMRSFLLTFAGLGRSYPWVCIKHVVELRCLTMGYRRLPKTRSRDQRGLGPSALGYLGVSAPRGAPGARFGSFRCAPILVFAIICCTRFRRRQSAAEIREAQLAWDSSVSGPIFCVFGLFQ